MWFMEQKMIISDHIIEMHDEPTMTLFDEYFLNVSFFSNWAGADGSSCVLILVSKRNTFCSMNHIEKINSFQDIALFENSYMNVKTSSRLQACSASLHIIRNELREGQNLFQS